MAPVPLTQSVSERILWKLSAKKVVTLLRTLRSTQRLDCFDNSRQGCAASTPVGSDRHQDLCTVGQWSIALAWPPEIRDTEFTMMPRRLASASTTWQGSTRELATSLPLSVRRPDTQLKLIISTISNNVLQRLIHNVYLTARMGNIFSSWFRRSTKVSREQSRERQHELAEMRQQLPGILPRRISKRHRLEERSPRWLVYDGVNGPSESSLEDVALPPPAATMGEPGMVNDGSR